MVVLRGFQRRRCRQEKINVETGSSVRGPIPFQNAERHHLGDAAPICLAVLAPLGFFLCPHVPCGRKRRYADAFKRVCQADDIYYLIF